ncbi:MAG: response regulator [Candidatus Buchananbacteria bacterium CG10_big_fil_rev_8_21_14_0_10_42_9]|uniref:Response regulator n=1 Tax=Candidatus Buchananbacteria bacterium CG10_big_fil_rev_8_21_14_0_10_42_9 TaxID=1974526 RepID=A0A2H0W2A3_9BACT|nr:MAG: response regulator [Candidatus Buchananbacteria bacterium CG10_big_fil_rev_8_21_14_0_10_42_9]
MAKKVLIIEDNQRLIRIYGRIFEKYGYQIIFAPDGNEGLAKMASDSPDVILLDLMLPGKDGFSILEQKKNNSTLAKIPVVVLSNLGQEGDKTKAYDLGANDYLVKSEASINQIVDVVKKYLG